VALIGGAALAMQVQRPIADLGVADRLLSSGQQEKATELLEKVVSEKPDLAVAHYLLGNAYLDSSKNAKAESEYVKAVALDDENLAYKVNLGVAYLRMDQPNPALAQFNQVLSKDPEDYSAQINVAIAYNELKDYDKSLAAIEKALRLKADDPKSYWLKGEAYLGKKDAGQAITAFQRALAIDATYVSAQKGLCWAYREQNNMEQAKACYQKFMEEHPDSEWVLNNLAWLDVTAQNPALRDPAKGLEYAKKAVSISKERNAMYLDTLAEAYFVNGQVDEAFQAEEKAAALDPSNSNYKQRLEKFRGARQRK